jgi:hypothetical protein
MLNQKKIKMKNFKQIFEETKGQLVDLNGTIGVIAGYTSNFLIAATTKNSWKEADADDDDCIAKEYLNKGYSFIYADPDNVFGYVNDPVIVTMLTLDELQKNPKVSFGFNSARQIIWVDHTDSSFIINNGMLNHFGKSVELIWRNSSYEDADGYGYEPWMYKELCL